ncbi:MAG: hypothetical protein WC879_01620 [Melioribacteraceae bacterium]
MFSIFETEIIVRPDDIDMNNHVHNSKYLDYLLTLRKIVILERSEESRHLDFKLF